MKAPTSRKRGRKKRKPGERWAIASFAVNVARLGVELLLLMF
ncbi:hypothetical protein [Tsukamurella paurometabola]|uniref:Uncharacterized protein n=1 Tax=Tsukamurella paurometabola (strain ATCC 8368 / DSM 20162 / CCUG 35730 / CIP 100753 / JCM 10117 / KCTC 9821 / NBRC 16120 / NCIMB 702349 / NCTC 13040) TaxID=521096 RepID=D5UYY3_TSUPD|nr:hypothetical protein [Tsukamurella paurometabola]ADG80830.1 hypothetical protein Tpau_4264 [Tsukamurella paurometabola DSM 20162]